MEKRGSTEELSGLEVEERGSVVLVEKVTFEQRLEGDKRVIQGSSGGTVLWQEEELEPCL